jgi:DNA repair protein RadD
MLTLRPYQLEAKHAVYDHLRARDDNPCVVIPTAGGKTPVMASVCQDAVTLWNGRVMILAHVKELLEQTADKLNAICPEVRYGVYSAGLKRRDTDRPVTIAGIQSVYQRACEFDPFDLVVIDEAHMIPPDGDGMYRQFLAEACVVNPHLRIVGFTATPYRLKTGSICTPDGFLNHVCYEVGVRELIVQGYLCPLVTKAGKVKADTSGLHVRAGEFVAGEVEALMDDAELVRAACAEVVEATRERNACLIFASGVKHGEHIVSVLKAKHDIDCGFVTGDTPTEERDATLARFKSGRLKYLCNVNVLTTGFDAPHIDCVALLRPTLSPGLYYQMVGRGFRLHPSKANCLVLDFGGNVLRHGPVDQVRVKERTLGVGEAPAKECPECNALIAAGYAVCPECGFEFPPPERAKHAAKASDAGILSGQVRIETLPVRDVMVSVHTKRGAGDDAPKSLRVDYKIGWHRWKSEWVCLEHDGFARQKAVAWWKKRSKEPVPATAAEAVEIVNAGGLAATKSITVRSVSGEEYDRITDHELGPIPELLDRGEPRDAGDTEPLSDDALDFPFGYNVTAATEEEIPW